MLEPMCDANELVKGVFEFAIQYGYNVGVLTAIPKLGRLPDCVAHKQEWLAEHFPVLTHNFNIGPHAIDKQLHAKPGDVLIDDSHLNIPQWEAAGGIGILHRNASDSLVQLFQKTITW